MQEALVQLKFMLKDRLSLINRLSQILFIIFLVAIEYLATTPTAANSVTSGWDKANHFIAFSVLYITLSFGFLGLGLYKKLIFLLIFGLQIEFIQAFLPNREFSLLDVLANCLGMAFGVLCVRICESVFGRKFKA